MSSLNVPASGALLSVQKLTKFFGSFAACNEIDLDIAPGEIHALLGENGAGKSTLVKMLFGVLEPTGGADLLAGKAGCDRLSGRSPQARHRHGLPALLAVRGADGRRKHRAFARRRHSDRQASPRRQAALSRAYGLPLDPHAHVADLSVGERQRIEIVRALLQNPKLIILDEPTSVLTPQEADRLFETLFKLKAEGRSVLYISHRLEEVQRICDRATVLRHGRVTGACDPRQETPGSLARMMVGSDVASVTHPERGNQGEVQLAVAEPLGRRRARPLPCR